MPDSPEHPVTNDVADGKDQASRRPPMPRWVKVFLVIVLLIATALIVSQVLGVQHGPGMHGALGPSVSTDLPATTF